MSSKRKQKRKKREAKELKRQSLSSKVQKQLEFDDGEDDTVYENNRFVATCLHSKAATGSKHQIRNRILMCNRNIRGIQCTTGDLVLASVVLEPGSSLSSNLWLATVWPSPNLNLRDIQLSPSLHDSMNFNNVLSKSNYQVAVQRFNQGTQDIPVASKVRLKISRQVNLSNIIVSYLNSFLVGKYLTMHSVFQLPVNGYECKLNVVEICDENNKAVTSQPQVFVIQRNTKISFTFLTDGSDNLAEELRDLTLDEPNLKQLVGGLSTVVESLLSILSLTFSPSANLQITPPQGILLYGAPGVGKTLIARSITQHFNCKLIVVNGPEVFTNYVGEAEHTLRQIFKDAILAQPSIIFVDEIDSLCVDRGNSDIDESQKRIVGTFLTLMDSLKTERRVVVLGATNRVNAIDPALRRPGRFDREIEVASPNEQGRREILDIHLRRFPNSISPQQRAAICSRLHGFVGADLLLLVKEAAWRAVRRCLATPATTATTQQHSEITLGDLTAAAAVVKPSALREVSVDVPDVRWSDIGGQEAIKQQLKEAIEWPLKHADAFVRMGIRPPQGVLLYGPPGCSKTLLAKAVATQGGMNFIAIKGPELFSKWVGESEKAIQKVFVKAKQSAPAVVFFDEIDSIASTRGADSSQAVADRVLSQLLIELDGVEERNSVVVIAATNRPDIIDKALLRPGRIDRLVYVSPPDYDARVEIFKIHTAKVPLGDDVRLVDLAIKTAGFSGAEVAAVCREACLLALQENIEAEAVDARFFDEAVKQTTPQIDARMLRFYQDFRLQ